MAMRICELTAVLHVQIRTLDAPMRQHLHPPTSSTMQQHRDYGGFPTQALPTQPMPLEDPTGLQALGGVVVV